MCPYFGCIHHAHSKRAHIVAAYIMRIVNVLIFVAAYAMRIVTFLKFVPAFTQHIVSNAQKCKISALRAVKT